MFRFHKTLDVLTLFHAPASAPSRRILDILETASVAGSSANDSKKKLAFELEVVEAPLVPTPDQLRSILDFVGENKVGIILKGSGGKRDAMKALEMAGPGISERVLRPLLVDWNNGRAVLGADEKAVQSLVDTLPK
ncbi:hypothetical protein Q9L58_004949 [Maublancomyces gigas]|uniref:Uncharacterized protein n=1 Tax=Discina gigas TaxID=1032678 RepID=A0ABR3GJB2_9PEZI